MEISQLYTVDSHENGAEMQVKDESGNDLDMYITLAGIDSKAFRKTKAKLQREIINGGDPEELRAEALADVTINWRGFLNDGNELEFTNDMAKQLYINAPYVMDQADVFINQRANFTKG